MPETRSSFAKQVLFAFSEFTNNYHNYVLHRISGLIRLE